MTRRTIVALGLTQCVNWGVLYYAFGALLLPMQRDLGAPQPVVAGAFSVALLVSAAVAPFIGRCCDRGQAPRVMRTGSIAAAALLWALALVPHVATLYLAWAGLGLAMAAALYEPAFAIVGRSLAAPRDRLRALSIVTVFGGLASTIFLPVTALLLERAGWRWTVGALGLFMAASAGLISAVRVQGSPAFGAVPRVGGASDERVRVPQPRLRPVLTAFALASFTGAAFTATAMTAFIDGGLTATQAALLLSLFGVMQLPGRLVLMIGRSENPALLAATSMTLQAAGLLLLAGAVPALLVAGVALFAVGNGVMTLVRPHLVQTTFAIDHAGSNNGAIARAQQVARGIGPFGAALIASAGGYRVMFATLAIASSGLAAWWWMLRRSHERTHRQELENEHAAVTGVL